MIIKKCLWLFLLICVLVSKNYAQERILQYANDSIRTWADTINLGEVVVRGNRLPYKMTSEGKSTQIHGTLLSKIGTASDVLNSISGIIKTKEGIEVVNKGVPLIFINNRQVRDMAELDQLKSENIRDVELITSPGVKYDATVNAVIKIRTNHVQGEGFRFDIRSTFSQSENTDLIEQFNWGYRHNHLDVFGMLYYKYENNCWNTGTSLTMFADTLWNIHFEQRLKEKRHNFTNMIGLNYSFNNQSVGFQYKLTLRPNAKGVNTYNSSISANNSFIDYMSNQVRDVEKYYPEHMTNFYYKGKLSSIDIDLNVDYLFNKKDEDIHQIENSHYQNSRIVTSHYHVHNKLLATKLTMGCSMLGGQILFGGEYSYTHRKDQYINYEGYIQSSLSSIQERHFAPYMEYSHDSFIGKFLAGVRYEIVKYDYNMTNIQIDKNNRKTHDWFPYVSLNSQWGRFYLQIAYTTKTRRPNYLQLSNNIDYANRYTLQSGNPFLKSEKIHDISLTGIWKKLHFSLGYNNRRNAIIDWSRQYDSHTALMYYINYHSLKSLSASVSFSPKIGKWEPRLSLHFRKQRMVLYTSRGIYNMGKPLWQVKFDNIFDLGCGWSASVNSNMMTKGNWANYYWTRNVFNVDINIAKTLLKDKLSIQVKAVDLLRLKRGALLYTDFRESLQISWYDSREVSLTIRYKFNPVQSKYKGTGAGSAEKERL